MTIPTTPTPTTPTPTTPTPTTPTPTTPTPTSAPTAMATPTAAMALDTILGTSAAVAKVIESTIWPTGPYQFQVTGIEDHTYEVKVEGHPFEGQDAVRIELQFTCTGIAPGGVGYKNKDKKPVPPGDMQDYIGKVFTESVMFGNDGLGKVGSGADISRVFPTEEHPAQHPGADKLKTFIMKILGKEDYDAVVATNGDSFGALINAVGGRQFGAPISHNKWGDNVNDQLDIMSDWVVIK